MKTCLKIFLLLSASLFLSNCGKDEINNVVSENDKLGLYTTNGYASNGGSIEGVATGENYNEYAENPFISTFDQSVSTFSVDADGGAYSNMRRFMYYGQRPPVAAVRIEEFLNYFTFDYSDPFDGENVALNAGIATCPWNSSHHLMRIGLKGKSISNEDIPAANFVFLIDVSGSMNSPDKLGILKSGFIRMTENMRDADRVAIVTYAGSAAVLLESTYGDHKQDIINAINQLGAGGSTAGAEGIITAYQIAESNFIAGGNNRVILGSDGDFNVGPSSTEELIELIEAKRESGIYLTVLGVGGGNLNDYMMEQVANKGNGNYEYIDNADQVEKVFVNERAKFFSVAKDSKFQLSFNPDKVDSFRLIGYENRMLENEDFEKDTVDAGEIGAGQTITAMYELVLKDETNGIYAQFDFRYKKPGEESSRLIQQEIITRPVSISSASENMRFAASVAGLGLLLRESNYGGNISKQMIKELGNSSMSFDPHGYRNEFIGIVDDL
jgi:Ca-activated chloride channel homolog